MPNWCENSLYIKHENPEYIKKISEGMNHSSFFNVIMPMPAKLAEDIYSPDGNSLHVPESNDWYTWRNKNWGTKWDIDTRTMLGRSLKGKERLEASFDTAWSPPAGIYKALKSDGAYVEAYFYEPGCDFIGSWIDGENKILPASSLDDDFFMKTKLGKKLNEEFRIIDNRLEDREEQGL